MSVEDPKIGVVLKCPHCGSTKVDIVIKDRIAVFIDNGIAIDHEWLDNDIECICVNCYSSFSLKDDENERINWDFVYRVAYGWYFFDADMWTKISKYFYNTKLYKSLIKILKIFIVGP